ncbi:MAG: mannitol dehydrogenase family protein, partial [Pseudomonadota bacterium]
DRVQDYETMKLRVLNAGHQIIANPGEILGIETISGCMRHPRVSAFVEKVQQDEIVAHVPAVPDMTPAAYVERILQRFANSQIVDTTRRVAFDGSSRHTGFIHPILRDALKAGTPVQGLALSQALWARMCEGTREDGSEIAPNDPAWPDLSEAARAARADPLAWLAQRQIYGDLADAEAFSSAFARWLGLLWAEGCDATLARYTG